MRWVSGILFFFLFLLSIAAYTQYSEQEEIDSLQKLLKIVPADLKPEVLIKISKKLEKDSNRLAEAYVRKALEISLHNENIADIARCRYQLARIKILQDSTVIAKSTLNKLIREINSLMVDNEYLEKTLNHYLGSSYLMRSYLYSQNSHDSLKASILDLQKALAKLDKNQDPFLFALASGLIADYYLQLDISDHGIKNYNLSLMLYDSISEKYFLLPVLIEKEKKRFDILKNYRQECLFCENIIEADFRSKIKTNLGFAHLKDGHHQISLSYFKQVFKDAIQDKDRQLRICASINMALFHMKTGQYDEAENHLSNAIVIAREEGFHNLETQASLNLVDVYLATQKYDLAQNLLSNINSIINTNDFNCLLSNYYTKLGDLYFELDNRAKALECYKKTFDSLVENRNFYYQALLANKIHSIYEQRGDYSKAMKYYKLYITANDALISFQDKTSIIKEEIRLEIDNAESELGIMRKNEKLARLELKRRNFLATAFSIGFAVLCLLLFFIWMLRTRKKKAYNKLMEKNIALLKSSENNKKTKNDTGTNSDINPELASELKKGFEKFIYQQKIYLKPNISLDSLAKKLNTNSNYLSRYINQTYQTNFTGYLNQLRIRYAQNLVTKKEFQNFSIEGLAKEVGYKSKSVFNVAFKKYTGVTPSFYINYIKDKEAKK